MATGSVDLVKELRERTGAGMMDCKRALETSGGDIEKAIDILRKKGMSQAAKRAGREANEGLVWARTEGKKAGIVEVNCETDFVARTDDFRDLTTLVLNEVLAGGEGAASSPKIAGRIAELSGKIGEKILVRRAKIVSSEQGNFFVYIHSNNKLGVIVEILSSKPALKNDTGFQEFGKNIAMQVAASNPLCLDQTEVPSQVLEREKAIFKEEVKGKPENIIEKIVQGKLDKFYQTNCLLEQPFIKDDKVSIQALLNQTAKNLSATLEIKQFVRFHLGEKLPS